MQVPYSVLLMSTLFCRIFIEDDNAKMFIQKLEIGDSVGCGINDDTSNRKVFFTRNRSTVSSANMNGVTLIA